jgi:hypothetical protein
MSTDAKRVWIAQCLCPQRHAIMAAANEARDRQHAQRLLAELKKTVEEWLAKGVINPWCGICHAEKAMWHYEIGRTRWETMTEANAALAKTAAENITAGILYGEVLGLPTKH